MRTARGNLHSINTVRKSLVSPVTPDDCANCHSRDAIHPRFANISQENGATPNKRANAATQHMQPIRNMRPQPSCRCTPSEMCDAVIGILQPQTGMRSAPHKSPANRQPQNLCNPMSLCDRATVVMYPVSHLRTRQPSYYCTPYRQCAARTDLHPRNFLRTGSTDQKCNPSDACEPQPLCGCNPKHLCEPQAIRTMDSKVSLRSRLPATIHVSGGRQPLHFLHRFVVSINTKVETRAVVLVWFLVPMVGSGLPYTLCSFQNNVTATMAEPTHGICVQVK